MSTSRQRRLALTALALLVPVPTAGALMAFAIAPGPVGQGVYFAGKLWIAALPVAWLLLVDRGRLSLSPLPPDRRRSGVATGVGLGLAVAAVILGVWELFGRQLLDPEQLAETVEGAGLTSVTRYVAFALYLIFVNSLLEEVVWRWFTTTRCEVLVGPRAAVFLSAGLFTVHHVVAFSIQMSAPAAALSSLGVFLGACIWSWCYVRFRSIWPGWICHAFADLAGLWIGWRILWGQ
jgi:hypothetical protein